MRIVAGEFKGRVLHGPRGRGTRPTADKTREALFSILGDISGARVLDLFAGTGALALEALSRGAQSAVLVERDRRTATIAARNIEEILGERAGEAELIRGDAKRFLGSARRDPFDLVLLDPPYADAPDLTGALGELLERLLAPGARVVTESDRRQPLELPVTLAIHSEHRYGDTLLRVHQSP